MATDAEQFLDAEECVTELLANLETLRTEIQHYSTSGKALEGVAQTLEQLVSRTQDLSSASHQTIEAIKTIGTAELLSRIDALQKTSEDTQGHARNAADVCARISDEISQQLVAARKASEMEARAAAKRQLVLIWLVLFGAIAAIGAFLLQLPMMESLLQ